MIASGTHANFGSWISPITSEIIASKSLSFTDIHIDNGIIYWIESRPNEKGRSVIVSYHQNGTYQDETPEEFSIGTSVHGYGGGAFFVRDQQLYFSNSKDGIVYHKNLKSNVIKPITEYFEGRFADFHADPRHEYLYCIRKDDSKKSQFPPTEIVQISLQSKKTTVLFTGSDFYSSPTISPNGTKISWLQWDHPNMPWDATELWIADVNLQGIISNKKRISIESKQSFYQPTWSSKNELFVSSDITGFWNIYKVTDSKLENIYTREADFGRPMWISGTRCFDFIDENKIISSYCEKGIWKTGVIHINEKSFSEVSNSLTCIYNIVAKNNCVAFFGGSETLPLAVILSNYESIQKTKVLRNSIGDIFQKDFISLPELIEFPTRDDQVAYAFYYKPKNPNYSYSDDQLPPLIVKVHGGPTANADFMFNPKVQYYTSRGFAYLEVNYRGSTGYGRNYREQLKGQWGIRDVEDCIDAALYLCNNNKVDKNKLIIAGSSSGGLTVLSSLAFHNIYKCGSCTYGIADLIAMTEHIHKFEAYYDQGLIGGSVEKEREKYFNRSPLNFANNIKSPIIFFHGDKDVVVHVSQTNKIVNELNKNKIYNEVYIFEGEGHGFKKAESIITSLNKELEFFKSLLS
ncbi:prolyl oligopeptidase family serine peptidase [Silvanigrella paludirubra]|nr:prolyl oligopeptidase family serine peptidase [Silvanigrella paludirubra]